MGIIVRHRGNLKRAEKFLRSSSRGEYLQGLDILAQEGANALASVTPKDSGITASAWSYTIQKTDDDYQIIWTNSHVNKGVNIALILQMGHGTKNGGYVQGRDYINPAIRPIFDKISKAAWEVVKS